MENMEIRKSFTWREFRRWRMLQIAALLPLIVIAVFMLYFKTAPALGVVAFFLVLIIGILLPQLKADSILSHFVLKEEIKDELREMIRAEIEGRVKPPSET
jgi:hypothetical protein